MSTVSISSLPIELLGRIFLDLSAHDLCSVLRVSSIFYAVAVPSLYRRVVFRGGPRTDESTGEVPDGRAKLLASQIFCLKVLCKADHLAPLVRTIEIDWRTRFATANLCRLLNRTLRRLNGLTKCSVLLAQANDNLSWI
jgi:hypothetical protein